ncbi:hypothetical protein T4B_5035 [Trichinella pseudospiralis]|uniref:Uncharacterized protein n=1 Tax=Trichinella pseudospiralis TaxID=6337 RepID=A0A0V1IBC4_TRIPS|nr:hypothetical protein T4E_3523 [Trichinella pseudospiralis]KRY65950.1 hypothetical protein T4A_660 [Trichinella pseudospiralis]KRZ20113.1 hypothetical protein T4B_5035 [Trichinella pseudospiralis]KRZ34042.1 hypothetical protein T4C_2523 [Trichinella pseudospiralis]
MELNLFVKCARSACTPNLNRKDSRYRRELVSASSPSSSQMNANRQQSMKQPDATATNGVRRRRIGVFRRNPDKR